MRSSTDGVDWPQGNTLQNKMISLMGLYIHLCIYKQSGLLFKKIITVVSWWKQTLDHDTCCFMGEFFYGLQLNLGLLHKLETNDTLSLTFRAFKEFAIDGHHNCHPLKIKKKYSSYICRVISNFLWKFQLGFLSRKTIQF